MPKKPQPKPTVLLIEDDPSQQRMYGYAFKIRGVKFLGALTSKDGLKMAKEAKPDLILLDLLLNGLNALTGGVQTLELIKKDKTIAHIPVIVFTNYTKDEILSKAISLGAEEVIVKTDVTPKELVELCKEKYLS
jgi:CheY-like chemotaxis protein